MSKSYEVEIYKTKTGKEPYIDWEKNLDKMTKARIDARLARIRETGNMGVFEAVGDGIFELKFDFGPGYRIYFGLKNETFLILLLRGYKKGTTKRH